MWPEELLQRRIAATPVAPGFLLVLPRPEGRPLRHARQLARHGITALVSLLAVAEARELGCDLAALARACRRCAILWRAAPIADFAPPGPAFERVWRALGPRLHRLVRTGRGVALHCRAGLGRSGTVAARLLIELGLPPAEAIARVRTARPGAIETAGQLAHLEALARPRAGDPETESGQEQDQQHRGEHEHPRVVRPPAGL